jgi:hypothetical protein
VSAPVKVGVSENPPIQLPTGELVNDMMAAPEKGTSAYTVPAHPAAEVQIADFESILLALIVANVKVPCP